MITVDAALRQARQTISAAEARQLLAQRCGRGHAWLAAHGEDQLDAAAAQQFFELVQRRAAGEPIAYLTGTREFYGRDFAASPAALIPRPETELLVDLALGLAAEMAAPRLLDLGCGSGCIAVTLALELPRAEVTAIDLSPAALALAARNATTHKVELRLLASDWFAAVDAQRFDLIVANPPYVAAGDPHLERGDLRFEPSLALAAGADGLQAIGRIVAAAPAYLAPAGSLLLEHGYDQAPAVRALFATAGFGEIAQEADLAGILRVTRGRLTPRGPAA